MSYRILPRPESEFPCAFPSKLANIGHDPFLTQAPTPTSFHCVLYIPTRSFLIHRHSSMAEGSSRSSRPLPGVDRTKAARLYIDGYYKNLLDQTEQRQKRFGLCLFSPHAIRYEAMLKP